MEAAAATISGVHCRKSFTCTPVATHDSRGKYSRSRIARISGPNNLRLLAFFSSCLSYTNERRCGVRRTFSSTSDSAATARDQLALVLEVDAFQKLGLDCAKWTEPIYNDLARKSDGDEEMMLVLYFNRIGWPSSLPTSEKSAFVKSVLQEKKNAMDEFMMPKDLPFRPGVQEFIVEACDVGIPGVILTAYSKCGEKVARVASAERQRIADKVVSLLKVRVELDTSSPESLDWIIVALRVAAESVGTPVSNCILVVGSLPGIRGSEHIGMPCIVVRNSFTAGVEIPSSSAIVMDGFGEPDLNDLQTTVQEVVMRVH